MRVGAGAVGDGEVDVGCSQASDPGFYRTTTPRTGRHDTNQASERVIGVIPRSSRRN
jgi:hypothetical protein